MADECMASSYWPIYKTIVSEEISPRYGHPAITPNEMSN